MAVKAFVFLIAAAATFVPAAQGEVAAVRSSADLSERLARLPAPRAACSSDPSRPRIVVSPERRFQTILGFGGTFSESSAYNLTRVPAATRSEVLQAFFSPDRGAGFSLLRTTINSCDASSKYYSYNEKAGDLGLTSFSIQEDVRNGMIPVLKEALAIPGADFRIFASPWTAPEWMKTSGRYDRGSLKPEYRDAWALYLVKYLQAYREQGVPIWGLTPQNEPLAYEQKWDAMGWTAVEMRDFLRDSLIPLLRQHAPEVKLIVFDHNKNRLVEWSQTLMADEKVAPAVWGFAHHWYEEGEAKFFEPVEETHRRFPDRPLIASEQGMFAPLLGKGEPAELYAADLIENMNHHAVGWIVWGLCFDAAGGPNHAQNFNHSPIMLDVEKNVVHYNPSYYYLAQVSKFVRPGAVRLGVDNPASDVRCAAFRNPDGSVAIVVLNATDRDVPLDAEVVSAKPFVADAKAHAITTYVFEGP